MDLPIICQFDPKLGLFRITRAKGKTLSSGGYGFAITSKTNKNDEEAKKEADNEEEQTDVDENPMIPSSEHERGTEVTRNTETQHYLVIEEVLFLHERGLLECKDVSCSETLDSSQLYQLLPSLNMSLAMYLVYSHLRSQDFRVLRHHPDRLQILKKQQEEVGKETLALKRQFRRSLQTAPPPSIPKSGLKIGFDVYMPNSTFSKTSPGLPDFYVAASYYHQSTVSFDDCQAILEQCGTIPLKVASVSDSGTVVMFGLTNFGVPTIDAKRKQRKEI
eukprot:scaffold1319_cov126-Cylindrotheca_fusiformis.AAC.13